MMMNITISWSFPSFFAISFAFAFKIARSIFRIISLIFSFSFPLICKNVKKPNPFRFLFFTFLTQCIWVEKKLIAKFFEKFLGNFFRLPFTGLFFLILFRCVPFLPPAPAHLNVIKITRKVIQDIIFLYNKSGCMIQFLYFITLQIDRCFHLSKLSV